MENTCQCPAAAAMAVALEALDEFGHLVDPEKVTRSKGFLKLNDWLLERVRDKVPCPDPQIDTHGHLVCPLVATVEFASKGSVTELNEAALTLPLTKLADDAATGHRPGQYL